MNGNETLGATETATAQLLSRVWTDAAFSARLESDPKAVLTEMGAHLPDDVEIRVVCDSDKVKYLHIPAAPPEGEVSDEDLTNSQGGTTLTCIWLTANWAAASVSLVVSLNNK